MRRFELVEGNSSKFWEIDRAEGEASYTVRFGRIGTNGQTQVKTFATAQKAEAEYEKVVAEKLRKGYTELATTASTPGTSTPGTNTPSASGPAPTAVSRAAAAPSVPTAPSPSVSTAAPPPSSVPSGAPPPDIDEDRIFWDAPMVRRAFAVRGHPLPAGAPQPSADAVWNDLDSPRRWFDEVTRAAIRRCRSAGSDLAEYESALSTLSPYYGFDLLGAVAASQGPALAVGLIPTLLAEYVRQGASTGQVRFEALGDLRARIASMVDDRDYADLATRAREHAARGNLHAAVMAFLFPTEAWAVAIADAAGDQVPALTCNASSLPTEFRHSYYFYPQQGTGSVAHSLVHRFGFDAVPLIIATRPIDADSSKERALLLARLGCDAAFGALIAEMHDKHVGPGFIEACNLQPRRAVRLLSAVKGKNEDFARVRLADLVTRYPTMVDAMAPTLSAEQQRVISSVRKSADDPAQEAPPEAVPAVLRDPPWLGKAARAARPVVPGVVAPTIEARVEWSDEARLAAMGAVAYDEFDRLAQFPALIARMEAALEQIKASGATTLGPGWTEEAMAERLAEMRDELARRPDLAGYVRAAIARGSVTPAEVLRAPEELVDEALSTTPRLDGWNATALLGRVLATYGARADRYVSAAASASPVKFLPPVLALASTGLALPAARAFTSKTTRRVGAAWLSRFPQHAAAGLIGPALGKLGKERDAAEQALRMLAGRGHENVIRQVAASCAPDGTVVEEAVAQVLSLDPLSVFPTKLPARPSWLVTASLEKVELRSGARLPPSAIDALVTMLSFSTLEEPYAGIAIVRNECTPESLARFAWSLFLQWSMAGHPAPSAWALTSLGLLGDDAAARKLSELVRTWPGEGGHARATAGLAVLAAMGTDASLTYLNRIAETAKFKGLKDKAQAAITEVAEARDLTREELSDRLVPDLDLDADGSLWLDYGPRKFRVGFDELLVPFVRDESGATLRSLPRPGQKDDADLASASSERWKVLKKEATATAKLQVRRTELAMCARRRWSPETFRAVFVDHPLMIHIARRLVWAVFDGGAEPTTTFRVAEDRTYADSADDEIALPGSDVVGTDEGFDDGDDGDDGDGEPGGGRRRVTIGIPHVLELGARLAATWGEVFSDYELLQPFPQLGRETFVIEEGEREATALKRVAGLMCHYGRILGLEYRGWERGAVEDGGVVSEMVKPLSSGLVASLELSEGLYTGLMTETPEQPVGAVTIRRSRTVWESVPLGELSPIEFSELVRDLEALRG